MKTIVFLGGGRITSALCAGLRLAGYRDATVVYDRNPKRLRDLRRESHVATKSDLRLALKQASMLVIAVRPGSVQEMLNEVRAIGITPRLCVSVAAGVPLRNLRAWLPNTRWVRTMPSPVCRIGRGLTAVCFDRRLSNRERARVQKLFKLVGQVAEVSEKQLNAFTAAYSPSHGYHALATLAAAAQKAGLNRETALTAAAHALSDGVVYWRESELNLDELLHEAATPGGVASATMAAMDRAGYARVVTKGLRAGVSQARRNGKR